MVGSGQKRLLANLKQERADEQMDEKDMVGPVLLNSLVLMEVQIKAFMLHCDRCDNCDLGKCYLSLLEAFWEDLLK